VKCSKIATCAAKRRYSYAYRFKANPVLAEMDIFVTLPDQQWQLVDSLIDYKTILKQQPGYVVNAIHRSLMECG